MLKIKPLLVLRRKELLLVSHVRSHSEYRETLEHHDDFTKYPKSPPFPSLSLVMQWSFPPKLEMQQQSEIHQPEDEDIFSPSFSLSSKLTHHRSLKKWSVKALISCLKATTCTRKTYRFLLMAPKLNNTRRAPKECLRCRRRRRRTGKKLEHKLSLSSVHWVHAHSKSVVKLLLPLGLGKNRIFYKVTWQGMELYSSQRIPCRQRQLQLDHNSSHQHAMGARSSPPPDTRKCAKWSSAPAEAWRRRNTYPPRYGARPG